VHVSRIPGASTRAPRVIFLPPLSQLKRSEKTREKARNMIKKIFKRNNKFFLFDF